MNPERWEVVERLLDDALDQPLAGREAFVLKASNGDSALEAEVLELLQACEDATDLLSEPPPLVARDILDNPPPAEDEFEPGDQVGSYRVLRLLGRGGMGAVYLAERADGFFEKQVALKVIRRAGTSEETLVRFEAERRILARLEHPDIVSILDGGTTQEGTPFVVMELALGDPIDMFCDRLKLPIKRRLELFRRVCEAVQYAHRNLVVHRDLKPSNVLVAQDGAVRLLDFGIATVLEAGASESGAMEASPRLTPEYASPEQVLGEPTTVATDVYALGVLLYELLSGQRPYEVANRSLDGIVEVVCHQTPPPPSQRVQPDQATTRTSRVAEARGTTTAALVQSLMGDLDAIILKALEKDPDKRYGSATELAEDLRRNLEGRPVRARPATRWYRTTKFVTRYRRQVIAVAAAMVLLGAGVVATTVQWKATERERALREREAERAGLAENMLLSTFAELGEGNRGATPIAPAEFVDVARGNLSRLTASPRLSAGLRNKLGTISLNLSQFAAADTLFIEALAELEGVEGAELERAEAMSGLGYRSLQGSQRGDSALVWFRQALEVRRSVLPPTDTSITHTMIDVGFSLYAVDSLDLALPLLREAIARPGPPLQRARGLEFLTNALVSSARNLTALGQVEAAAEALVEAEQVGLESLDVLRRNGAAERMQYGNLWLSLAQVRLSQGNAYAAEEAAVEALRTYENLSGLESQRAGVAWGWIGRTREQQGDLAGAEEAMRRSREIFVNIGSASVPRASSSLADVLIRKGEFGEAESLLISVLDARPLRPRSEREAALTQLETLYSALGRVEEAARTRRRRQDLNSPTASP